VPTTTTPSPARSHRRSEPWNQDAESDGFKGATMPRLADGARVAYDAKQYCVSRNRHFYESNTWTYSYFVLPQMASLVARVGGP